MCIVKQDYKAVINTLLQIMGNTTQQSVPSKPVEDGYAVTDVVNVPSKDEKNDKKVCMYVCTYVHFHISMMWL